MKVPTFTIKENTNHKHPSKDHASLITPILKKKEKSWEGGTSITSSTLDVARWAKNT